MSIPAHIDWLLWRLVVSEDLNATRTEIVDHWDINAVLDAHDVLDALDDARRKANKVK